MNQLAPHAFCLRLSNGLIFVGQPLFDWAKQVVAQDGARDVRGKQLGLVFI